MKIFKRIFLALIVISLLLTATGCYIVSGQKMSKVKGTYKLAYYTRTPKHERDPDQSPTKIDYVNDEGRLYEDYLIVTGEGKGYYVHKAAGVEAYVKEVTLSYEYNAEDGAIVDYVIYNDAITVNSDSGVNRLGINKNTLNYSKIAIDYTELITGRKMRSEEASLRWDKVDKATDLSYVQEILGPIKEYSYQDFGKKGVYEMTSAISTETGDTVDTGYQYCYFIIDPVKGANKATLLLATKEDPFTPQSREITFEKGTDWQTVTLDGITFTLEGTWNNSYVNQTDETKTTIVQVSREVDSQTLEYLIQSKLPATDEG